MAMQMEQKFLQANNLDEGEGEEQAYHNNDNEGYSDHNDHNNVMMSAEFGRIRQNDEDSVSLEQFADQEILNGEHYSNESDGR